MDYFSSLPDNVFLQIFCYLPFKDRVRAGGVNGSFHRISRTAVSETKSLVLSEAVSGDRRRFTPYHLRALLTLCAKRLEQFRILAYYDKHEKDLIEELAEHRCPKLRTFECNVRDPDTLEAVLRNHPNLKVLIVNSYITYPNSYITTSDQLETLHCWCTNDGFRSLMGRVPNLRHFKVRASFVDGSSPEMLYRFLDTVPYLESLQVRIVRCLVTRWLEYDGGTTMITDPFWRLGRLTVLEIDGPAVGNDYVLMKIGSCFRRLRVLSIPTNWISNRGLAALSSLTDLRELTFHCDVDLGEEDVSAGVRALTEKCQRLRKLRFVGGFEVSLSPDALTEALYSCPELEEVELWDLAEVDSEQQAVTLIQSLAGLSESRRIRITFYFDDWHTGDIWQSKPVEDALRKLSGESGVRVEFLLPGMVRR